MVPMVTFWAVSFETPHPFGAVDAITGRDHILDEFGGPDGIPGAPPRRGAIVRTFAQLPRRADACLHANGGRFFKKNIPRR